MMIERAGYYDDREINWGLIVKKKDFGTTLWQNVKFSDKHGKLHNGGEGVQKLCRVQTFLQGTNILKIVIVIICFIDHLHLLLHHLHHWSWSSRSGRWGKSDLSDARHSNAFRRGSLQYGCRGDDDGDLYHLCCDADSSHNFPLHHHDNPRCPDGRTRRWRLIWSRHSTRSNKTSRRVNWGNFQTPFKPSS